MKQIELSEFVEKNLQLRLEFKAGQATLPRYITTVDINRPGLAITGFFKNFATDRIQVFGRGECAYLKEHMADQIREHIVQLCEHPIPAVVFTHGNVPPDYFIEIANEQKTPLLVTSLSTHAFAISFSHIVGEILAPQTALHGVLMDVFGVGILLMGSSGIGKSETALELIERGHRLVSDDIVQITCLEESNLYGISSEILQHNMELRGLGIINIKDLFGVGAIRNRCPLDLVILLEDWDSKKEYERIGLDQETIDILGVTIPHILLPIRPGRNIPILIETTAINHRSALMGYHAAATLDQRIASEIENKKVQAKQARIIEAKGASL